MCPCCPLGGPGNQGGVQGSGLQHVFVECGLSLPTPVQFSTFVLTCTLQHCQGDGEERGAFPEHSGSVEELHVHEATDQLRAGAQVSASVSRVLSLCVRTGAQVSASLS